MGHTNSSPSHLILNTISRPLHLLSLSWLLPLQPLWPTLASLEDTLASLEATVLSLDLVLSLGDMAALLEVTVLWEALVTLWLEWQAARRPTSPCTSLCRARTGASPSPRLSDPLSLLSLTILAPPTVSAPTG